MIQLLGYKYTIQQSIVEMTNPILLYTLLQLNKLNLV
jgi:hypothetical protein